MTRVNYTEPKAFPWDLRSNDWSHWLNASIRSLTETHSDSSNESVSETLHDHHNPI